MLRTVNVILTEQTCGGPALIAATALARRMDAHLDVMCLAVEAAPIGSVEVPGVEYRMDRDDVGRRADALVARVRAMVSGDLRATVEPIAARNIRLVPTIARLARFSDLAVTGRPYGPDYGWLAPVVTEGLIFGAGVPVLVIPDEDHADWSRPFRHLCLAWNSGNDAMRAARAALPFLREAARIDVAVIEPAVSEAGRPHPTDMLHRWLARHQVEAEMFFLGRTDHSKADTLAQFAVDRGCEALVMGAYGHSRLREALLGGTTRDMLAKVPLPLLMVH